MSKRPPALQRPSLATGIAFLALLVAMTGTSVAATGTLMNIADPSNAARLAKVTAAGQLHVSDGTGPMTVDGTTATRPQAPAAPLGTGLYVGTGSFGLLGPTSATLAISRLSVYNTALNRGYANTDFVVRLARGSYSSSTGCQVSGNAMTSLRVPVGSTTADIFPSPLVFRPTGTTPYCVMVSVSADSDTNPDAYYLPYLTLTGFVAAGTYTGFGSAPEGDAGVASPATPPLAEPGKPLPAGTFGGG